MIPTEKKHSEVNSKLNGRMKTELNITGLPPNNASRCAFHISDILKYNFEQKPI